jgi:ornithine decarboxylase
LDIVDIGGGFLPYEGSFRRVAEGIHKEMWRWAISGGGPKEWIAEPGRFFASDAVDLFVQVIGKKPGLSGKSGEYRYTIDESLYGQFSCIPFDRVTPTWLRIQGEDEIKQKTPRRKRMPGVLFGRTCDSLDVIAKGPMEELNVGDWLYFPLMGAYTSATASEFNGFPKPEIIEDKDSILPSLDQALYIKKEFYKSNVNIQFSNSLVPII